VLQGVAVCCIMLQRVAMIHAHDSEGALNLFAAAHADGQCCSVLQCVAVCCNVLQCVAVCCSVLQCVAVCCSVLSCVAVCCSVLQHVAACCSVLR